MINGTKILAIIPARGGSKRLPGKNIRLLAGKPLIAWTINAAQNSKYIDRIVVSSDSENILDISKEYGAETIKRPPNIATDSSTSFKVVKHVVDSISEIYDFILLLQPTSPLRNEHHINEAIEMLVGKKADAVISVSALDHSPLWSNTLPSSGDMKNFLKPEIVNKRSQDLPQYYRINGAIYICRTKILLAEAKFIFDENSYAYKMEQEYSIDIDSLIDFKISEMLLMDTKINNQHSQS